MVSGGKRMEKKKMKMRMKKRRMITIPCLECIMMMKWKIFVVVMRMKRMR